MLFSSPAQLQAISRFLEQYARLPFARNEIPGAVMEWLLAQMHGSLVLKNYDFVDVIDPANKVGWQVKSTKASTPITWKRAKIPDKIRLIAASRKSRAGCQALGDALLDFCNAHAVASFNKHPIDWIGYSRLVIQPSGHALYFEQKLCTRQRPEIFNKGDFVWHWSSPKKTTKKEQLTALHGVHRVTNQKWFAWHGLGENQLHFSGESSWWPKKNSTHAVAIAFSAAKERFTLDEFIDRFARISVAK